MINFQNGGQMTTAAFNQIPYFGSFILIIALTTFAYSTILGWSYYGERCAEYLFGRKAILPYKLLYIAVLIFAPVLALDMVWTECFYGSAKLDCCAASFITNIK